MATIATADEPTSTAPRAQHRSMARWVDPSPTLRWEGAALLVAATVAYAQLGVSWWWFAALFLVPDVGIAGYAIGTRVGAVTYNLTHGLVLPLALGTVGVLIAQPVLAAGAAIWVAHIGFDRALGFGLKYPTAFRDTHMQRVA